MSVSHKGIFDAVFLSWSLSFRKMFLLAWEKGAFSVQLAGNATNRPNIYGRVVICGPQQNFRGTVPAKINAPAVIDGYYGYITSPLLFRYHLVET